MSATILAFPRPEAPRCPMPSTSSSFTPQDIASLARWDRAARAHGFALGVTEDDDGTARWIETREDDGAGYVTVGADPDAPALWAVTREAGTYWLEAVATGAARVAFRSLDAALAAVCPV